MNEFELNPTVPNPGEEWKRLAIDLVTVNVLHSLPHGKMSARSTSGAINPVVLAMYGVQARRTISVYRRTNQKLLHP